MYFLVAYILTLQENYRSKFSKIKFEIIFYKTLSNTWEDLGSFPEAIPGMCFGSYTMVFNTVVLHSSGHLHLEGNNS